MLEAIGAGSSKRMGGGDWGEKWRASEEFAIVKVLLLFPQNLLISCLKLIIYFRT